MPQYLAKLSEITAVEDLSAANGAEFREVLLLDDRDASIHRFDRRAADVDDPWIRHHHRLVGQRGGPALLGRMYDDLLNVVRDRPGVTIVPSVLGAVEDTVELVTRAMRGPVP